jgi:hypothetical protein
MRDTMKQRRPDLGLQIFDLLAKRGLAYADLGCRPREMSFLGDSQKISDVAQLHCHKSLYHISDQ